MPGNCFGLLKPTAVSEAPVYTIYAIILHKSFWRSDSVSGAVCIIPFLADTIKNKHIFLTIW